MSQIIKEGPQYVYKFLRDLQAYCAIKRSGHRPRITPEIYRQLLQYSKTGDYSAIEMVQRMELLVKKKRVQTILKTEESFQYRRPREGPYLSPSHVERKLQRTVKNAPTPMSFWNRLVWSDEKEFTLEGPNGSVLY